MQTINNWQSLEPYGIITLTGEADNIGFRLLCDLTEDGANLVRELFGLPYNCTLAENWNSGSETNPHISSVMLPYDSWKDLAILALWKCNVYPCIIVTDKGVFAPDADETFTRADWTWDATTNTAKQTTPAKLTVESNTIQFEKYYGNIQRVFTQSNHPHVGTRNVHAMSGRSS